MPLSHGAHESLKFMPGRSVHSNPLNLLYRSHASIRLCRSFRLLAVVQLYSLRGGTAGTLLPFSLDGLRLQWWV